MLKYSPLFVAIHILVLIAKRMERFHDEGLSIVFSIFPLCLLFIIFYTLFCMARKKLRYVAIGKTEVVIKQNGQEIEYNWLDVERISFNRFTGLYKLKMKSQDAIYFTSYRMVTWLFGDISAMGAIINKMRRELKI